MAHPAATPPQVPLEAAVNAEAVADYRDRQAKRQRLKEQQAQVGCLAGVFQDQVHELCHI